MKPTLFPYRNRSDHHPLRPTRHHWLACGVALGVVGLATTTSTWADSTESSGFLQQVGSWQSKMSDIFRDTWNNLKTPGKPATSSASLDLREQHDSYMVRLHLPDRELSKVEITLEGTTLKVVAPAGKNSARYEQAVVLPGAGHASQLKIERIQKDNMVVVTVPKASATNPRIESPAAGPSTLSPLSDWDRDILDRMERMRQEMNQMFDDSFKDLRLLPGNEGFFDIPSFGSSVDMREEGSNYVVSLFLPGRESGNVKVTLEGQVLRIEAAAEETKDGGAAKMSRKAQYSQWVTLPGPVNADKMKVENKAGMLTVTVPKA